MLILMSWNFPWGADGFIGLKLPNYANHSLDNRKKNIYDASNNSLYATSSQGFIYKVSNISLNNFWTNHRRNNLLTSLKSYFQDNSIDIWTKSVGWKLTELECVFQKGTFFFQHPLAIKLEFDKPKSGKIHENTSAILFRICIGLVQRR